MSSYSCIISSQLKDGVDPAQYAGIVSTLRQRVSLEHGVALHCVCLLRSRTVPKTTSGKIARSWCRKAYQDDSLSVLFRWDGGAVADDEDAGAAVDLAESSSSGAVTTRGGNKYSVVGGEESVDGGHAQSVPLQQPSATTFSSKQLTVEEVRGSSITELTKSLEFILSQVASQGPLSLIHI